MTDARSEVYAERALPSPPATRPTGRASPAAGIFLGIWRLRQLGPLEGPWPGCAQPQGEFKDPARVKLR